MACTACGYFPVSPLDSLYGGERGPGACVRCAVARDALQLYELSDVNPSKIHITVPHEHGYDARSPPPIGSITRPLDHADMTFYEGCRS